MLPREQLHALLNHLNQRIVGQPGLCQRLMVALLADGHLLVEGAPGLAKTRAIGSLAGAIAADFHRIQFTPDLLPSDITGSEIYRPETGSFTFQPGPLFHNLVLADEINRAPAKVQAALLEAMGERQISVGAKTYPLPPLFLVMATQNPIEQEGTYPLPEAQLDRFLLHVLVDYPDAAAERRILALARTEAAGTTGTPFLPVAQDVIFAARRAVLAVHMDPAVEEYVVQLVLATRNTIGYGANLKNWINYGASPRATIALDRCARVMAWLDDRDYVTPDDIRDIAPDVLRHRILLNFEAEAEGVTTSQAIAQLLNAVPSA